MRKTLLFLLLLFAIVVVNAQRKKEVQCPNILFLEVDDLNYEYVGFNGATVVQTPNVDKLAETGVYFENAVCQGMMCGPSRNSLISGLYPHNMGFYQNGQMKSLPPEEWTLPKAMNNAGYYTAWIGKCHIRTAGKEKEKTQNMKTQIGFDFVQQTLGRTVLCKKAKKGRIDNDWYLSYLKENGKLEQFMAECGKVSTLEDDMYLDGFFTKNAVSFLDDYNKKEPFFLWLNYSVPHPPFDAPQKYHEPFKAENMPGSTKVENYTEPEMLVKKTRLMKSEDDVKKYQEGFCSLVSFMDVQVGKIIETLKKNGLYDNTIIVFFSDHGVMMGDHQRTHKGTLFREVTTPTLIVSWPAKMKQGVRITQPVELADLIRTSLEIAGADEKDLNKRVLSVSLLPALYKGKSISRDVAFGEIQDYIVAVDGKYRLIKGFADNSILLFDDNSDPKNLINIADEHPDVVQKLSDAIDKWIEATGKPLAPKTY